MTKERTPIGEITLVGTVAYQIYSRIYYGRVEYFAEIGKPWTNHQTGVTKIIAHMKASATRDYQEAARIAAARLDELQSAQFKHSVQAAAQSVSPLERQLEPSAEEPGDTLTLKLA